MSEFPNPVNKQLWYMRLAVMLGVGYAASLQYGIAWGLLYFIAAEEWLVFRLASWLLGQR